MVVSFPLGICLINASINNGVAMTIEPIPMLFCHRGVGQKNKNNGVTVVISKNMHKAAIAVGLGLEQTLSDVTCKRIIDTIMIPSFRQGDYNKGILNGLKEVIRILENN